MTHTLFPHGAAHSHGRGAAAAAPLQKLPSFGHSSEGRLQPRSSGSGGAAGSKTRFVLSRTEDAIDSVLPCAAERMFWRPGRFGNPSNLHFSYQA
jgi:hypothetical protein